IMRVRNLCGRKGRRFKTTTRSDHGRPVAANVLDRQFSAKAPNEVWVGDITYLLTSEGWLYLAVLIDMFSRAVVGWATSESLERGLCIEALQRAVSQHRPPRGFL